MFRKVKIAVSVRISLFPEMWRGQPNDGYGSLARPTVRGISG